MRVDVPSKRANPYQVQQSYSTYVEISEYAPAERSNSSYDIERCELRDASHYGQDLACEHALEHVVLIRDLREIESTKTESFDQLDGPVGEVQSHQPRFGDEPAPFAYVREPRRYAGHELFQPAHPDSVLDQLFLASPAWNVQVFEFALCYGRLRKLWLEQLTHAGSFLPDELCQFFETALRFSGFKELLDRFVLLFLSLGRLLLSRHVRNRSVHICQHFQSPAYRLFFYLLKVLFRFG